MQRCVYQLVHSHTLSSEIVLGIVDFLHSQRHECGTEGYETELTLSNSWYASGQS